MCSRFCCSDTAPFHTTKAAVEPAKIRMKEITVTFFHYHKLLASGYSPAVLMYCDSIQFTYRKKTTISAPESDHSKIRNAVLLLQYMPVALWAWLFRGSLPDNFKFQLTSPDSRTDKEQCLQHADLYAEYCYSDSVPDFSHLFEPFGIYGTFGI